MRAYKGKPSFIEQTLHVKNSPVLNHLIAKNIFAKKE